MGILKEEKKAVKAISKSIGQKIKGMKKFKPGTQGSYFVSDGNQVTRLTLSGERGAGARRATGPEVSLPSELQELTGLTSLSLSNLNLAHIPEEIGYCYALEEVNIRGARCTDLPDSIGAWENLKKLYLMNTDITTLPGTVGHWKVLEELLIHDSATQSLPLSVHNWKALKLCQLRNCQFQSIPLGIFGWTSAERLWLHTNPLMGKEDGKLVQEAMTWGVNGYSEVVGPGIPFLLKRLHQRFKTQHPENNVPFQENPEWKNYGDLFNNKPGYINWQLQNYGTHELLTLGNVYKSLQKYDEAKAFYQRILQTQNLQNAVEGLREIEEMSMSLEEKEKVYEERAQSGGIMAINWVGKLADIKLQLEKYEEAISLLIQITQKAAKNGPTWRKLGEAYLKTGNKGEARKCFETLLDLVQNYHSFGYSEAEIRDLIQQSS